MGKSPGPIKWSLYEEAKAECVEAKAECVEEDEIGMPITVAWCDESETDKGSKERRWKSTQRDMYFPEEIDKAWTVPQYMSERENIVQGVLQKTPSTIFHGWIVKHVPRAEARMAVIQHAKTRKTGKPAGKDGVPVRCTLDRRLHEKWWWYGHRGEHGETQASEIESGPLVQTMDDLFV